ncbi:MAG TPA: T9SS type A sorting domain-containing protein, partial [Hymenobacter sp.]
VNIDDVDRSGPVISGTIAARGEQPSNALPVHPNPANQEVTIDLSGFGPAATVQVYMRDVTGKLVVRQQVQFGAGVQSVTLPVLHLPQGLFLVTVQGSKIAKTAKLVITK